MNVLTEREIDAVIERTVNPTEIDYARYFAVSRAIEDAVMYKARRENLCFHGIQNTDAVTEREAWVRERAAYTSGYLSGRHGDTSAVNECYPIPFCDKCGQVLP